MEFSSSYTPIHLNTCRLMRIRLHQTRPHRAGVPVPVVPADRLSLGDRKLAHVYSVQCVYTTPIYREQYANTSLPVVLIQSRHCTYGGCNDRSAASFLCNLGQRQHDSAPVFVARKRRENERATRSQHGPSTCVFWWLPDGNVSHQQRRILAQGHIKTHAVLGRS